MVFFLKLVLTPVLIAIATLAARRYGLARGGWLAGMPLVSGPVSIFLALEEGPDFAATAALSGILGLVAVAAFCVAYVLVARRAEWLPAALAGIVAYLLFASGLAHLRPGPAVSFFLALAAILAARAIAGRLGPQAAARVPPWWDIPVRMASAAAMVLAITECALFLGARWSGLLSPFPVFASIMAVFSHREVGGRHHRLSRLSLVLPGRRVDGQAAHPPLYLLRRRRCSPCGKLDLPSPLRPQRVRVSPPSLLDMPEMTE
jgi:hypothetical protein